MSHLKKIPPGVSEILRLQEWEGQPENIKPLAAAIAGEEAEKGRFLIKDEFGVNWTLSCFHWIKQHCM